MREKWKKIADFNSYEVSNFGRVRNWMSNVRKPLLTPKILSLCINRSGYYYVYLQDAGRKKYWIVSRLVLTTFKGAQPSNIQAAHLDGNRLNNHLLNLKWKTAQQNSDDKYLHGTIPYGKSSHLSEETIRAINNHIIQGINARKIAEIFKVSDSLVSAIKMGVTWSHLNLPKIPTYLVYKILGKNKPYSTVVLDEHRKRLFEIPTNEPQPFRQYKTFLHKGHYFNIKWLPNVTKTAEFRIKRPDK